MALDSIDVVVERQLCAGCGACAYAEPRRFRMANALDHGMRPFLVDSPAPETGEALALCPGAGLDHQAGGAEADGNDGLRNAWGPILGVWEGYACDAEIRHAGSSGGAASALALYCLERERMGGVLHTAPRDDVAYLNTAAISHNRGELLARTGSRYAPASPVERLGEVEAAAEPHVFIGKPCDVAAVQNARRHSDRLHANLGLVIGFFCAGTPSTRGTLELLRRAGVADPERLGRVRYRGHGWPGRWQAVYTDEQGERREATLTYAESWDYLQRYRQWRCYICPDHTGEFADIAVGDPWYRGSHPDEAGKSLLVARTRRGLEVLRAAQAAGYIALGERDDSLLPRSQPNLLATRAALWGRLLTLRLLGAAVPRYQGFHLAWLWLRHQSLLPKLQSLSGTAKRVLTRRLYRRVRVEEPHDGNAYAPR